MSRTFTRGRLGPRTTIRRARQPWRWAPFALRLRLAQLRNAAAQRRVLRRSVSVGIAVVVVGLVVAASARSRAVQQRWGATVEVVVLGESVEVGQATDGLDWRLEHRPVAFVAGDALRSLPNSDDVVVRALELGDVATERDLRSTSPALVPGNGRRAVSIPLDPSVPPLVVGDRVDVFLIADEFAGASEPGVDQLNSAAVVLDVNAEAATLAVEAGDVHALAEAAQNGRILIALR